MTFPIRYQIHGVYIHQTSDMFWPALNSVTIHHFANDSFHSTLEISRSRSQMVEWSQLSSVRDTHIMLLLNLNKKFFFYTLDARPARTSLNTISNLGYTVVACYVMIVVSIPITNIKCKMDNCVSQKLKYRLQGFKVTHCTASHFCSYQNERNLP